MNATEIQDAISAAFSSLAETNQMIYDYWISELYDEDGNFTDQWTEKTLNLMHNDVMQQILAIAD